MKTLLKLLIFVEFLAVLIFVCIRFLTGEPLYWIIIKDVMLIILVIFMVMCFIIPLFNWWMDEF